MEILINLKGNKNLLLRSQRDCYEICFPRSLKDKDTGEKKDGWYADKFHTSLNSALQSILEMKVRLSDARSLVELQQEIKRATDDMKGLYKVEVEA